MSRPKNLPEYNNPPINEVVLGVQFATPEGYQQIYSGEVWGLFKAKFPNVEAKEALPPILLGSPRAGHIQFGIISGASHDRFWFSTKENSELLQFQQDRFLHNWRKVTDETPYVRFDYMIEKYEEELNCLENYFTTHCDFLAKPLNINQCELTYISHIPLLEGDVVGSKVSDWINLINLDKFNASDFAISLIQNIPDDKGNSVAMLSCEAQTTLNKKGKPLLVLNITVRGIPQQGTSISSAVSFLKYGREKIVDCFDRITTDFAHKAWRKI